jgi:hypothetical protein
MNINQKYYAMNSALNAALIARDIVCPVYKYGVVAQPVSYPYMQTTYRVTKRQPYASSVSGVLIDFEYVLNFFTAAGHEKANDTNLFIPYETARELITSPESMIWSGIANILNHDETPEFNFKGGLEVIQRGLVFNCQAVAEFISTIHGGVEIPVDDIIETIQEILEDEYISEV